MPQTRFNFCAQDDFQPLGYIFLNKESEVVCFETLTHILDGLLNFLSVFEIYSHTPHVAFVNDGSRIGFDDNRIAQIIGRRNSLLGSCCHATFCTGDAICFQYGIYIRCT